MSTRQPHLSLLPSPSPQRLPALRSFLGCVSSRALPFRFVVLLYVLLLRRQRGCSIVAVLILPLKACESVPWRDILMRFWDLVGGHGFHNSCSIPMNFVAADARPCISDLAVVRLRVAAGVSPAVEPWRLARRHPRAKSEWALNLVAGSGRQDAALYGRRDACRYRQIGDAPGEEAHSISGE